MHDLRLWRLLRQDTLDADALVPLLRELRSRSTLEERWPFLGLLDRVLEHPDARLRAAGASALGGASGYRAWQRLVAALDDPEEIVWRAAVEALRASCPGDPARWFHVLFHPRLEVR